MSEMLEEFDGVDLEDVDLGDMGDPLEEMDLSSFGEVDTTIDDPHIKVSTKSFKEFLKVAKQVCASGGRDIISKAVCLKADGDKLICKATDFDVYVEKSLELLNTENVLKEAVVIPTDILIKLAKAVPVNTVIFKKDDSFYMRLYGGDIVLDTHQMSDEKFTFTDEVEETGTLQASDLYSVMKDMATVVTAAVSPAERRIICEPNKAFANYMFAIIMAERQLGKFDLKVKDISVLKTLTVDKKEEMVKVYRTKESVSTLRCVLEGDDFKYAFLISDAMMAESMRQNIGTVVTKDGVFVDFIQLYKMIEVASELPYAIGKVGINYTEDGISVDILTKKGGSNSFNITGSKEGNTEPLKNDLVVQAKLLKIILRSFASKSAVKITVSENGLGIQADDYSSAVYSEVN